MKIECENGILNQEVVGFIRKAINSGSMVQVRYLGGDESLSATIDQERMKNTRAFIKNIIGSSKDFSVVAVFESCVDSSQAKTCCHPFKCFVRSNAKYFGVVEIFD